MTLEAEWFRPYEAAGSPPLTESGLEAINQSNLEPRELKHFFESMTRVIQVLRAYPERTTVEFPRNGPDAPADPEFILAHWREVCGRCRLAVLTANATIHELLLDYFAALNSSAGVLALALIARASLEHAAVLSDLARKLYGRKEYFEEEVNPFLRGKVNDETAPLPYAPDLVAALTQFQHGIRFGRDGPPPLLPGAFKDWMEQQDYGSKETAVSEWIDALGLKASSVVTQLKNLAKSAETMHAWYLYSVLSEFCHPNGDNRSISVVENRTTDRLVRLDLDRAPGSWGPSRRMGLCYSLASLAFACDIHTAALSDIEGSHFLTAAS